MGKRDMASLYLPAEEAKKPRLGPDAWPRPGGDCTAKWVVFNFGSSDVVEVAKYCYLSLLMWCKALNAIAPQASFVDHETIGINFKDLPEGVDPKYFPLFYKQLRSIGENLINDENVIFLMPWFHFMSVAEGIALCDKVLNSAMLGAWEQLANHTISSWERKIALDEILPLFFAACKYGTNSATTLVRIISKWKDDDLMMRVVVSNLTIENWNHLFRGAAWNECVRTALVVLLNSIIKTLEVKADMLSNPLLAHLTQKNVEAEMDG